MARHFVPVLAVATLAIAACYAFDDGGQASWTFETRLPASDVKQRSTTHLSRTGYQVLHADDRMIEAEKQRDAGSFDVLRVIVESPATETARVRIQALSEEVASGSRTESRSVSSSAIADGQALVDALVPRPGGL